MSTSITTGQQRADSESATMGVASLSSKRRLETSGANAAYPNSPKQAKKSPIPENYTEDSMLPNGHEKCSSEFLTTSILARTLLTSSSPTLTPCNNAISSSPLESLKSSLEALPAPMFLESLVELQSSSSFLCSLPKMATIRSEERGELEFGTLFCHDRSLSTVTVLSPIDGDLAQGQGDWDSGILPMKNPSLTVTVHDQLITEDENGKSYFNLGPSEATVLAKKTRSNPSKSPPDETWTSNSNSLDYLDDTSSSSSCESISSEDLFNSCEEYDDASEDEEEVRTYKQQRSNILHLSLCKLNSFRTQQCAEPSLHRSVLICNTLRHIEQEIRQEDEVKKNESTFLQSRETLPPFWASSPRKAAGGQSSTPQPGEVPLPVLPVIPNPTGHDPYLSSSLYNDSPYSPAAAYDYNSPLRPSQTPFHTPSYDYPENDLSSPGHAQESSMLTVGFVPSPSPSLLECDSGYAEDIDLSMSSYYYAPPTSILPTDVNNFTCSVPPVTNPATEPLLHHVIPDKVQNTCNDNCSPKIKNVTSSLDVENNVEPLSRGTSNLPVTPFTESWSKFTSPPSAITSFAHQQESQCGMESLRSDFYLGSTSGHSIHHHHQLPMDSLVSPNYSAT